MHNREKKKLEDIVQNTIIKYHLIENEDKIVVGVSGGPDSMCLLDNLVKMRLKLEKRGNLYLNRELFEGKSQLNSEMIKGNPQSNLGNQLGKISPIKLRKPVGENFEIAVAHLNHKLRKEADEEAQYVKKYCEKNKVEFYTKSIDVKNLAHTNKIGTEEAGRMARYEFFNEVLKKTKANKIAIAHNKNDKVETILLHILRGSGIEGLKGIDVKRGNIIRPLIECERSKIEEYCEENQLHPRIDQSNFENIYNRNKIRNVVIPYIQKELNPNMIKTMERLSDIVRQEDEYVEKQMKKIYQELVIDEKAKEIIIDLKKFNLQEIVIKSRLVRYIIKRLFGTTASIEKIHIEDIIKLCDNNIGNKYLTPNKNFKVFVKNHNIYFTNQIDN